jgi:hypothetical protein
LPFVLARASPALTLSAIRSRSNWLWPKAHAAGATWPSGRIDAVVESYESHADSLELIEQRDQVLQVAPQAIQSPTNATSSFRRLLAIRN